MAECAVMTSFFDSPRTHCNGGSGILQAPKALQVDINRPPRVNNSPVLNPVTVFGRYASAMDREKRGIPTTEGRSVRVRVCTQGEAVQLAIIGKRGSMVEAVSLDATQLPSLIAALQRAKIEADSDLMGALKFAQGEADKRYRAALARNPWLNGDKERGLA